MRLNPIFKRILIFFLFATPLGLMAILTMEILLPSLKEPQSNAYSSGIGYPSSQRSKGSPIEVEIVTIQEKNLENKDSNIAIVASGTTVGDQQTNVNNQISAVVEKIYVQEGDRIKKGQLLLELNETELKNELVKAQQNLEIAQEKLTANKKQREAAIKLIDEKIKGVVAQIDEVNSWREKIDFFNEKEIRENSLMYEKQIATLKNKIESMKPVVEAGALAKIVLMNEEEKYWDLQRQLLASKRGLVTTRDQEMTQTNLLSTLNTTLLSLQGQLNTQKQFFDAQVTRSELDLKKAQIDLEDRFEDLQKTRIYAPIDGLVTQVNVEEGEFVVYRRHQNGLVQVTNNVVFKAYVDQAQINQIKVGDQAEVNLVSHRGEDIMGRVVRVNPSIEGDLARLRQIGLDKQNTYPVWIKLEGVDIPPGIEGFARFSNHKENSSISLLPEETIIHLSAGKGMVMVMEGDRAAVKNVSLGKKFGNQRQVIGGLDKEDKVIVDAIALKPGDRVVSRQSTQKGNLSQR